MNSFEITLLVQHTSESGAISIIYVQANHRFSNRIWAVQCNFLTDILDLVYLRFASNVKKVHLSTEEPAASRILEPFGEVDRDFPEYFSSRTHFAKIEDKKVIAKN